MGLIQVQTSQVHSSGLKGSDKSISDDSANGLDAGKEVVSDGDVFLLFEALVVPPGSLTRHEVSLPFDCENEGTDCDALKFDCKGAGGPDKARSTLSGVMSETGDCPTMEFWFGSVDMLSFMAQSSCSSSLNPIWWLSPHSA